jgi:hemolysin III
MDKGVVIQKAKWVDRSAPAYTKSEEIFNMVSHIVGGAFSIAALTLCVVFSAVHQTPYGVAASAIYGATMIILYTMSSIYHGLSPQLAAKRVFRVIDHCSVFLLIAGTYTPIALSALREQNAALGWISFSIIWAAAALGITLNAIDLKRYRVFSMICYLAMGWGILIAGKPTYISLGTGGFTLLLAGGILYTIGAVVYAKLKKIRYSHSVFHLFVLAGSILHFFCILFYVV